MYQAIPLTETLQAATYDQNIRIGALPFFNAVATRQLNPDSYVALLSGLATIYESFHQALEQANYPILGAVWDDELQKQALLRQDLAVFAAGPHREIPASSMRAHVLAEQFRLRMSRDPLSLLGGAYVLATWNMGGATLCAQITQALGLSGTTGIAFLASFDAWGQAHWPQFAARLDAAPLGSAAARRVVQAAQETLDGIEELIDQLHPLNESQTSELVTLLNPLAGNHMIASDIREIQAALRAGERTWRLLPYYELRYGQKGRKYTWSDSNWLVALAGESQARVNEQIQWLSRYLATRGMPQWMMECHLQQLHEDLVLAVPEKRDVYATLAEAARMLAEERRTQISDATLEALDEAFYARVGPQWNLWLPHCGSLLASAVADDRLGIAGALESLQSWMTDTTRFPALWIDTVHTTISHARQQAR
ncbi:MAG: biliverdin-producing heme oxygenase [Chloroflexales bacterium]|nr:biliverdin-producing heme oxygenase [Chloroflexales bacterium]